MRILLGLTTAFVLTALFGFSQEPKKQIKKVPMTYTDPTSGSDMFRQYCAACHGADGKGTGPAAVALKKVPTDLTLLARKNGGKYPSLRVLQSIKGDTLNPVHGNTEMPVWGEVLQDVGNPDATKSLRLTNLTNYIETIQQK